MFLFKNAFISIIRNKGRNFLIGVIILVIACASTVALAINNTASDLINSYESAYDKELSIVFDRKNMMKDMNMGDDESRESAREKFDNISSYTISDIKEFAKSDHIEDYYYTYNISLDGKSIEKAESEKKDRPGFPGDFSKESLDFKLEGYSSVEAMSDFVSGTYEMVDIADNAWDIAFDGSYVFINEELASYNNLSLNDKIELQDEDGNSYEFEVIGIYKENESDASMNMFSDSVNTLITNADCLEKINSSNNNVKGNVEATFKIDDYKNADKIKEEFYKKGLDENFTVKTNEDVATSGLSSVKNVKSFANTFLIITLIIGGVVLFVINMINIRERKYEIGVLRTIGISKFKLTLQFVCELLIVSFVSLMIGVGIGAISSKGVSNILLSSEIKSSQNNMEKVRGNFGGPEDFRGGPMEFSGTVNVQAYKSIDAVVNLTVLFELLAIGLSLILISSLASMISIQRFTPLTILKERS